MAAAPCMRRHDDAIDIDEAFVAFAKPEEVRAVVIGLLVEGHDECFEIADAACVECLAEQERQPFGFEPGQFGGMLVVERQYVRFVAWRYTVYRRGHALAAAIVAATSGVSVNVWRYSRSRSEPPMPTLGLR